MILFPDEDTIVATSTPHGRGAISVIRVSGKDCLTIINQLFLKKVTPQDHQKSIPGTIRVAGGGEVLDQVVVTYFHTPHSYTGEDLIEISCHGNPLIVNQLIHETILLGARPANPGEFTQRAFLNHKLDLIQAEAVADIINAQTKKSLMYSTRQLHGRLSQRIKKIEVQLIDLISLIEVSLDFNENDIAVYKKEDLLERVRVLTNELDGLIDSYSYGKLLLQGIKLVILGKPNVGKSSLLNVLLEKERAIVSEIPGTTRDYIEGQVQISGIPIQIIDTAGIRQTSDPVEIIGMNRAWELIETADIILVVFEAHQKIERDDVYLINLLDQHPPKVPIIITLNKTDLGKEGKTFTRLAKLKFEMVDVSALTGYHIPLLKEKIIELLHVENHTEEEEILLTNARHYSALCKTREAIDIFRNNLEGKAVEVILAADLRGALDQLGLITGLITTEDILNNIFGQFCIGK
jgi:tRNA modification GTPase